ncbi:MAG: hypothetical protein H0W76_02735 [Pyrinomonadaceae bacterium]|nr:hypothetical protein [Pyrinomonadaceae bacterium]
MKSADFNLLEQLASGIVIFELFYRRGSELLVFLATGERLLKLNKLGVVL